jgi:hypothetical protein
MDELLPFNVLLWPHSVHELAGSDKTKSRCILFAIYFIVCAISVETLMCPGLEVHNVAIQCLKCAFYIGVFFRKSSLLSKIVHTKVACMNLLVETLIKASNESSIRIEEIAGALHYGPVWEGSHSLDVIK